MRHLDRSCFFALVLIAACHAAESEPAPAADGNSPTPQGFAGNEASSGAGGSAAGHAAAGASGGSTEQGGAAGHFCQGAGGFANDFIVQGTNEACELKETGECASHTPLACCPVKGAHYRWDTTKKCRRSLPIGGEVATCALMDFAPVPGGGDPCSYTPSPNCFLFKGTNDIEVVMATDYWRPSQIGAGWEICAEDFQTMIADAVTCP